MRRRKTKKKKNKIKILNSSSHQPKEQSASHVNWPRELERENYFVRVVREDLERERERDEQHYLFFSHGKVNACVNKTVGLFSI